MDHLVDRELERIGQDLELEKVALSEDLLRRAAEEAESRYEHAKYMLSRPGTNPHAGTYAEDVKRGPQIAKFREGIKKVREREAIKRRLWAGRGKAAAGAKKAGRNLRAALIAVPVAGALGLATGYGLGRRGKAKKAAAHIEKEAGALGWVLKRLFLRDPVKTLVLARGGHGRVERGLQRHRETMRALREHYPAGWVPLGMRPR